MRIIGGKDYYDGALSFGQDPKDVLKRTRHDAEDLRIVSPREAPIGDLRRVEMRVRRKGSEGYGDAVVESDRNHGGLVHSFVPERVWFAGRRHGGMRVRSGARFATSAPETRFVWGHRAFVDLLDELGLEMAPRLRDLERFDAEGVKRHFTHEGTEAQKEWLIGNRVSIAIWTRVGSGRRASDWNHENDGWVFDTDGLKEIGFSRRLDPWTAFQELAMYVGGVLPRPAAPTVDLTSERIMVAKHGFDEWTFRRMPGGR